MDTLLGKRFTLDAGSMRIGRGALNEIVLDEEAVSGRHAHLERAGERWQLVDDGSTHGTLLNDTSIKGEVTLFRRRAPLRGQERWPR